MGRDAYESYEARSVGLLSECLGLSETKEAKVRNDPDVVLVAIGCENLWALTPYTARLKKAQGINFFSKEGEVYEGPIGCRLGLQNTKNNLSSPTVVSLARNLAYTHSANVLL